MKAQSIFSVMDGFDRMLFFQVPWVHFAGDFECHMTECTHSTNNDQLPVKLASASSNMCKSASSLSVFSV